MGHPKHTLFPDVLHRETAGKARQHFYRAGRQRGSPAASLRSAAHCPFSGSAFLPECSAPAVLLQQFF